MRHSFVYLPVAMIATMLSLTAAARGDLTIAYTPDGSPAPFQLNVNQQLEVPVYVLQTDDTTVLSDLGLVGAGVRIELNTTAFARITHAQLAEHWDNSLGGAEWSTDGSTATLLAVGAVNGSNIFPASDSGSVLIGNFILEGVASGVTTVSSRDRADNRIDILAGDLPGWMELDDVVFANSPQAQFTTVPEPGTFVLALLGLLGTSAVLTVRRRRMPR